MSDDVKTGERYAKSPMTGNWYRVTKWIDHGDGKIQARAKTEVTKSEVPDEVVAALEDGGGA
jgi:hypothetical protein